MKKSSIDFKELDIRELGSWPVVLRIPIIIGACLLSVFIVYALLISGQIDDLDAADKQESAKRGEFSEKYNMAQNLTAYEKQTDEMNASYKFLLKQLPSDSNIPDLIESMSKIADKTGLKFQSIKLGDPESKSGFYKQLSIELTLLGTYHNFGRFISYLSSLPRIVTLHDFSINRSTNPNDPPGSLVMIITARTYWLSNDTPPATAEGKAAPGSTLMPPLSGASHGPETPSASAPSVSKEAP